MTRKSAEMKLKKITLNPTNKYVTQQDLSINKHKKKDEHIKHPSFCLIKFCFQDGYKTIRRELEY